MALDLSGFTAAAQAAAPDNPVFTAMVVRADESGLWVAPLGEDPNSPVGPCKGGWTANGTRVPPGALVALIETDDGPWAIGVDNPALAISDGTLAPFPNPSFELENSPPGQSFDNPVPGWSDFWNNAVRDLAGTAPDTYTITSEAGSAAHGLRALRIDGRSAYAILNSSTWSVPPGSNLEVSFYARADGPDPICNVTVYSNDSTGGAGPFGGGTLASSTVVFNLDDSSDWLRYRATYALPPTHTKACLFFDIGADEIPGATATVWLDNVDADLVDINPAAEHQDFIRRATETMLGGGSRLVTAGGNIAWTQPFTIAGAGLRADEAVDGRFAILQPPNDTVIPVHSSGARTSHTVAGGVIALNPDDALWYELPLAAAATSQPARFHIIGSSSADDFDPPPHWIMICRRASAWSSTSHAPEYKWGDGRQQDPWRTPSLNAGWVDGTIPGRFSKTGDGQVLMRGRVRSGAGSAFTLPQGYWPAVQHEAYVRDGAGSPALITVTTAGVVTTAGNNSDHSIATAFAVAEQ